MSSETPRPILIAITDELPLDVEGGLTTWTIEREYYGRNDSRLSVKARCRQTGEVIVLIDGTSSHALTALKTSGILVQPNTTGYKIALKLLREGRAVKVVSRR